MQLARKKEREREKKERCNLRSWMRKDLEKIYNIIYIYIVLKLNVETVR